MLTIVVLAWNQLPLTQACVASLRATTDVPYELVIVDNGSRSEAAAWAAEAADVSVSLERNLGFAAGMNAGLAAASGDIIAFVNNDTRWPAGWTTPLLEHFEHREIGIVAPAVSAAGNPVTVRASPRDEIVVLDPFSALPSGVVYLLRTDVARSLGGFTERYEIAMSEDIDLCFTVWANDLEIVIDARVVVDHELHASLDQLEEDRTELWRRNLDAFLDHWTTIQVADVPWLPDVDGPIRARNLRHARSAASWLRGLDDERARLQSRIDMLRTRHTERVTQLQGQVRELREAARPEPTVLHRVRRRLPRRS